MHHAIFAVIAFVATLTLAVPMPFGRHHHSHSDSFVASKDSLTTKRIGSFKTSSSGRRSRHGAKGLSRNARAEVERTYRKFNWQVTFETPDGDLFSIGYPGSDGSSSSSGSNSSSGEPSPYGTSSSSSTASAVQTSSAADGGLLSYLYPSTTTSAPAATSTASAGSDKENGEVSAEPEENESEYLSSVTIGGQKLELDFDTGSADLWVFSTELSSSDIGQHATYNPDSSSTSKTLDGADWKIQYGDGSGASGTVVLDTVDVGGATATGQAVEIATQVSSSFVSDENNDGLLGLAFSTINTVQPTPQKTFFENIMPDLDLPVFTADLEDDAAGTYEFGTIDASKYEGDIHYTTVDSSHGFWEFDSTTYTIAGKTYTNDNPSTAIADTGTSLLLVDEAVAKAYYAQIDGSKMSATAGGYVYPCDADVPEFGVAIGDSGFVATIPGEDVSFAQVGASTCFGGIQGNSGQGLQIFGDVLLKQYFAVFNGEDKKFGVAKKSAGNQQAGSYGVL